MERLLSMCERSIRSAPSEKVISTRKSFSEEEVNGFHVDQSGRNTELTCPGRPQEPSSVVSRQRSC